MPIEGAIVRVTASVGVASAVPEELDPNSLVGRADRALYAAKDAGRNTVRAAEIAPEDARLRRVS